MGNLDAEGKQQGPEGLLFPGVVWQGIQIDAAAKPETKPETKTETKTETKAETKPETKTDRGGNA